MSYTIIPVPAGQANPSFSVMLDDNVFTQINLMTTDHGLFMDVVYGGNPICNARLCTDRTSVNNHAYLGMPQALFWADTQGNEPPQYSGFNTRWLLCYGDLGQG